MQLEPGENRYEVHTHVVRDVVSIDPGASSAAVAVLMMSPALATLGAIATHEQVALARPEREYEMAPELVISRNPTGQRARDRTLASMQYGERVFDLQLEAEFVGQTWAHERGEEEGEPRPVLLTELTPEEQDVVRETGKLPERLFWDSAFLAWVERGGELSYHSVGLLTTGEQAMAAQLLRLLATPRRANERSAL